MVARTSRSALRPDPVQVPAGVIVLEGDLAVPPGAHGVVLFAHGSGSGRHSPRNRAVATALNDRGFATLLLDLLTQQEEVVDDRTAHIRFDIPLLAGRLAYAAEWLGTQMTTRTLPLGLFGASTGAGAALITAAQKPDMVKAVVSRGGRPDLAHEHLPRVKCPTLLIIGGRDEPVIELNEQARAQMTAPVTMEIVAGATHLFEEPGTLEKVAELAANWFDQWLR
ncbi:MAG TPA: alpha/beta family hydrolase [Phycisphaerales bacterium]|nr:alpha/beta family hydrolase [Phycisphaerales bacterium]